jgi:hypothetical protein
MYCNILHTLSPQPGALGEYASQLFQAVLAYAQSENVSATTTFNDPTGEAGRSWLYDALDNMIMATLDNDPSLNSTVRNDLMSDLTALQTDMKISASDKSSVQSRTMLAEMNVLISNMAKWMTFFKFGVAKLWGLSGFTLAQNVFARAAAATRNLTPLRIARFKAVGIASLVSPCQTSSRAG